MSPEECGETINQLGKSSELRFENDIELQVEKVEKKAFEWIKK